MNFHILQRHAMRGFTLTEVLVALVIGLIGTLVMLQVFAVSEGQKRTTTNGSDSQTNGGVGLYMIERDVRMAGYGIATPALLDCPSITVWNNASNTSKNLVIAPFMINPPTTTAIAGDAGSDVILMGYSSADLMVDGVGVTSPSAASPVLKVDNRAGFNQGDLVIGVQSVAGVTQCAMHEITNVPGGQCGDAQDPQGGSNNLIANTGNYKNQSKGCQQVTPTHNNGGGIPGIAQLSNPSTLFNLGGLPSIHIYAIRNQTLTECDGAVDDCTLAASFRPLVNDIVAMRAVYGYDANNNQAIDNTEWTRTSPATGDQWRRLIAVRLAVVSRSPLTEKQTGGVCNVTADLTKPDQQTWIGNSIAGAGFDLSTLTTASIDAKCYRYKLFQTVVPLRNMIWRELP